jgi:hypothetical protein
LGGGIGCDQLREGFLQREEPSVEIVIVPVGDLRPGFYVVEMVVSLKDPAKSPHLSLGLGPGKGLGRGSEVQFLKGQSRLQVAAGVMIGTINGNLVD